LWEGIGLLAGLALGALGAFLWLRPKTPASDDTPIPLELPPIEEEGGARELRSSELSRLPGLIADALRDPLARVRRMEGAPTSVRASLDHLAARLRLLDSRPRPMHAKSTSPITLLQEVAEEVDLLRTRAVGVSWSLRTRKPVMIDPERSRLAFLELLEACAEAAHAGGKVGIRVVPGHDPCPVQIEIEIGRRFAEVDELALLVVRHVVERWMLA
jgi:hypothetical protein